jgi:ribulose-phosphate 3-epimerase
MHIIAPSVLSANFAHLEADIDMINKSEADWFHVDVMDGVFVPNISFGFPVMKVLQKLAKKPLDVHLMIVEPDRYVQAFREAGAGVRGRRRANRTLRSVSSPAPQHPEY